jgi:hypothetical protein
MKRARLLRYSVWQMKDFAIERGIMVVILALLNMTGPIFSIRGLDPAARVLAPGSPITQQVTIVIASLILLAILFSSQEIISRSRKQGYYRLILAKPVNPVLFYAQLFVVHLIGTVALLTVIAMIFSLAAIALPIGDIALLTAFGFILFGGVSFLFSAFLSHDAVALIAFVGISLLGKNFASSYTGFGPALTNLLLPVDHLSALRPLLVGESVSASDIVWVLGYGLAGFVLGLIAIRYRQIAD